MALAEAQALKLQARREDLTVWEMKKVKHGLATLKFIANCENIVFLGPPGVGKTHLAVALGIQEVS